MRFDRFISGFPGVGKSFLVDNGSEYKDSDSSAYAKKEFPRNYIDDITLDGQKHFISSHEAVRAEMRARRIPYTLVYPNISLMDEYVDRYIQRKNNPQFIALVAGSWTDWIMSCSDDNHPYVKKIELTKGQYLKDVMSKITAP